ncbi:hypothetical protein DFH11DRAFT_1587063 [Phellopilus nigrolimitatus]|nr:hypothetical protein DFH11DRAFT_1587063 [Phellopilus nigrolimitatus]
MSSSSTQDWLKGLQMPLDSFFDAPGSSAGRRGNASAKRKREGKGAAKEAGQAPSKRPKTHSTRDKPTKDTGLSLAEERGAASPPKAQGSRRGALLDVTAQQNSPRARRRLGKDASAQRRALFASPTRRSPKRPKGRPIVSDVIELDDSSNDASPLPRPSFGRTPIRPLPKKLGRTKGNLPTPPSSNFIPSRTKTQDPPVPAFGRAAEPERVAQTPVAGSSTALKANYMTPETLNILRLKFASPERSSHPPLPALKTNLALSPTSSLTPLSFEGEEPKGLEDTKYDDIVPSSQTQYLVMSPPKNSVFTFTRPKPLSMTTVPSSQSQPAVLSPRKTRKPAPLFTRGFGFLQDSTDDKGRLNLVVPTSQEDEVEISLLDATAPRLSQMLGAATNDEHVDAPRKDEPALPASSAPESASLKSNSKDDPEIGNFSEEALPQHQDAPSVAISHSESQHDPPHSEEKKSESAPSTQFREFYAMLERLDRLADESLPPSPSMENRYHPPELLRPRSRVASLSSPNKAHKDICDAGSSKTAAIQSQSISVASETQPDSQSQSADMFMQSSVTEPDPWNSDDDPFSVSNSAYRAHLGLSPLPSPSRRSNRERDASADTAGPSDPSGPPTCTQSSVTQVDSDEEDPFPTLPPTSTAASRADREAVRAHLLGSQELEHGHTSDEKDSPRAGSLGLGQAGDETQPMPDIGSLDDTFDVSASSPLRMAARARSAFSKGKFRRRDRGSFVIEHEGRDHSCEESGLGTGEPMPSVVKDFLSIFDEDSEAGTQSAGEGRFSFSPC